METLGSMKSNNRAVTPDRSVTHRLREGNGRVQIQRKLPKLASDSSSQSSDTTNGDLVLCELGWRSSKNTVGAQMKNLLANEMSKETESKRRSPNVIARLMGLDGLPPQQLSSVKQKGSSGNSIRRIVSTKKAEKNSTLYTRQSSRKSSKEEQEFKDVFEVLDVSKMESNRYPPRRTGDSKLVEAELSLIQQKFIHAKRLSTDEKLQDSKEFHDTIDDLDCNKDLLLKLLEQPDSLLTKHLPVLQDVPSQSHCSCVSATKSSYAPALRKNPRKPNHDFVTHCQGKHTAHTSSKSDNIRLTGKNKSNVLPTRIVVLKPNLGKVQKPTRTVTPQSSLNLFSECSKQTRVSSIRSREPELGGRNKLPDDLGASRNKPRESRELAKESRTKRSGSTKFATPGFRGCAGVESLSNISENDSAIESEVTSVSSRNSIDLLSRRRPSSSCPTETYMSRVARKRLSERWKLTHRSVDIGEASRSSTLREMLSIPDSEVKLAKSDIVNGGNGSSGKLETSNAPAGCAEPSGISSRDGWKEGCISNLSRSRSLPASSTDARSPKTGMRHETAGKKMYMTPNKVMQRGRDRMINGISTEKESASSRSSRLRNSAGKFRITGCTPDDGNDRQNQVQSSGMEDIQVKQKWTVSETSASTVLGTALIPAGAVDVDAENIAMPANPIDPEISVSTFAEANSSAGRPNGSSSEESSSDSPEKGSVPAQQSLVEPESTASSKEADQPSPVSVLETPFLDDVSSGSECFESLSADLHGLRVQLELLKLESEQYTDGPMLVSSDEEPEEVFVSYSEEKGLGEESSEFCYLVDLLQGSGLNDADPDTFLATWHSPECPVHPLVFEELEKSYCSDITWTRSERKLLFDRVNSTLLAIHRQVVNPHPWVKRASGIASGWTRNGLEHNLQKVLASKDKKWNRDAAENMLARQSQWLDFGNEVDVIGREIERILTEELVQELVKL